MYLDSLKWAKSHLSAIKRLNPGGYCVMCMCSATTGLDLCSHCAAQLPSRLCTDRNGHTTTLCLGCGLEQPLQALQCIQSAPAHERDYCSVCTKMQGHLSVIAPYRYAFPLDHLIKRMKFGRDRQLARVLGTLLGRAVDEKVGRSRPRVLLPMPLHPARQRQRGFNQAEDIAYWAGKCLQVPISTTMVSRIVDTDSMSGLNRQERQLKILGAFRADDRLFGQRVVIIDDVLTTGASARELAREVYDSGALSVELWVLARTSSARKAG